MNKAIFDLQRFALSNYNKNSLVGGTSSADTIRNYAGGATVRGAGGNDYIYNSTNSNYTIKNGFGYVTIDGGSGNDTILSYDPNVSISGGAGNDKISLRSSDFGGVTISGGTGNDTIYGDSLGGGVLYQYKKGDGNDLIYNYNSRDSITVSGATYSTSTSGNNILVNISGGGKITLVGAKGKSVNINPSKEISSSTVTQQDVIKKFMASLDTTNNSGMSAINQAVKEASGGYFSNANEVISKMIADCQASSDYNSFLKNYCGIILDNTDTGAITGSDSGGKTAKNASNIVPESGSLHSFTGNSFTVNGVTFQLASFDSGTPKNLDFSSLTDSRQKYIWQALETWWAKNALDLIKQSYGDNYVFGSGAMVKKVYFGFYNSGTAYGSTEGWFADSSRKTISKLAVKINMNQYNSLIIGNQNGKISGKNTFYLDRVIAHELTHAVMYSNINYSDDLPKFIREGMAELTHGADDDRKNEIIALAKNPSRLKEALLFDSYDYYAGGYMFLKYLAKQSALHYPSAGKSSLVSALRNKTVNASSSVSVKGSVLTATKNFSKNMLDLADYSSVKSVNASAVTKGIMILGNQNANSISAGKGDDTIFANTGKDTIFGGAGNDIIYGDAGNDSLFGDAGNDSFYGGLGNDTLTGGDGSDVFIFGTNSGIDTITDYTPGEDKIRLIGGSLTSATVSGSDVTLYFGKSTWARVKNGKNKNITVIDKDGNSTTEKYSYDVTITDSDNSPVTVAASVKVIKASSRTKAVKITGNLLDNSILGGKGNDTLNGVAGNDSIWGGAGNDTIYGGEGNDKIFGEEGTDKIYGGAGNDTLTGGKGNDSLWGNSGADNFIYASGDGQDVIFGFEDDDLLKITGTFSTSYSAAKKEIYFKVDSTSKAITLKDFSATSFKINGTNYKISGSKLIRN